MRIKFLFPLALALALVLTSACQTLSPTPAPDPVPTVTGDILISDKGFAYSLTIPPGWKAVNCQDPATPDIHSFIIYHAGPKPTAEPLLVYFRMALAGEDQRTPEEVARLMLKVFRLMGPAKGRRLGEVVADSGARGEAWWFEHGKNPTLFTRVAYFPNPDAVVVIVASTGAQETEDELKGESPAFDQLAKSYRWLGRLKAAPEN